MLPIVYVHLGDKPAPHLIDSLRQSRRVARGADIYAILTRNTAMAEDATGAGAVVVYTDTLPPGEAHRHYINSVRRRLGKKRGFWRFATERFFFIEELMLKRGLASALHLESDNLIFFDPAEIEVRLRRLYPGMAAPFWNDTMCIPGVVYVGDRAVLGELTAYIARRVAAERDGQARWYLPKFLTRVRMGLVLNDMNMLAAFKGEYGPAKFNVLPMVPPGYDGGRDTVPHAYDYSYGFDELGMVFDGLALGPALGGLDPAHHTAAAGEALVREHSYVDGASFGYDDLNLRDHARTPCLTYRGRKIRLASLHNHAKAQIV
jgi:hypothetical protein